MRSDLLLGSKIESPKLEAATNFPDGSIIKVCPFWLTLVSSKKRLISPKSTETPKTPSNSPSGLKRGLIAVIAGSSVSESV